MAEKKPYLSDRANPPRMVDVYMADQVQHLFAEGTARTMMGPEVSKIEFTRVTGSQAEGAAEIEVRETFATLTLPTMALVELSAVILENYGKNAGLIQAGHDAMTQAIRGAIKRAAAVKL